MRSSLGLLALYALPLTLNACSTGGSDPSRPADAGPIDLGPGPTDAPINNMYDSSSGSGAMCDAGANVCSPIDTACLASEICGNGADDDCDGHADEHCPCDPGTVQPCFLGPPGHREQGACIDGHQICQAELEFGVWGDCTDGIWPTADVCDGADNDCDGCPDVGCCGGMLQCPQALADGQPFQPYEIDGRSFYAGAVASWMWTIAGGPCEDLIAQPSFTMTDTSLPEITFTPTLSGDYTVTLTIQTPDGVVYTCTFVVHIAGPGLRIEMCWDRSTRVDVDLYLHRGTDMSDWFATTVNGMTTGCESAFGIDGNDSVCDWSNCGPATCHGNSTTVDWGYANSPLENCEGSIAGSDWADLGYCPNPRLDIDNNLSCSTGTPENINIDNPGDGDSFRIMAQNFTGGRTKPMINVYCNGHLKASLGVAPDYVNDFLGSDGSASCGAMWRAADVTMQVDSSGTTTDCDVTPLHPPGQMTGWWVTYDDGRY